MPALKVPKKEAEPVKRKLKNLGLYDGKRRPRRESDFVLLPVVEDERIYSLGYEVLPIELPLRPERQIYKNLESVLAERLSEEELRHLRRYDVVGDIAVIQIPPELEHRVDDIVWGLRKVHPFLKVVAKKGFHEGAFRIRDYSIIWGEKRLETVHRENGVEIKVDLSKAFFNPRMKGERYRLAQLVKDGERILIPFAGVLPYALVIAKYRKVKITAVELNREAYELGLENIERNRRRLKGEIEFIYGDAFKVLPELPSYDRVISPTPRGVDALSLTLSKAERWLHYYDFVHENEIKAFRRRILEECQKLGRECSVMVKKVSDFKPHVFKVCANVELMRGP
ncbi:tRNA (guanine-N1)-methyltransferase [Thermococcus eurythermalis]|uniref:tRNA (Guanine-N1)-methyltransferase n=1 Tax=Thermococcus eurythermalis TaxID=1505907 RepID=A0A097QRF2_9EURY|nr:class I SAM-dependent methyltransferase family protein [Thermococcus eurythermalis]AIU69040.1 tRNA (guanine-N1)-methyltransferase [Thermococcus eurythermalis]